MLPTFVIGLREGLEAALIVGIIAAFLRQQGRRDLLRWVWLGVGAAVLLCVAVGVTLEAVSSNLPQRQQEGLETVVGVLAVGMVTYMVVWMRQHSRELKSQLEGLAAAAMGADVGAAAGADDATGADAEVGADEAAGAGAGTAAGAGAEIGTYEASGAGAAAAGAGVATGGDDVGSGEGVGGGKSAGSVEGATGGDGVGGGGEGVGGGKSAGSVEGATGGEGVGGGGQGLGSGSGLGSGGGLGGGEGVGSGEGVGGGDCDEGARSRAGRAMVLMAFLAVLREGFETVVFLLAAFNESGSSVDAGVGALAGILLAVLLGYGIYRGGVRLNLSKFFRGTGIVLVLVAAGLVVTALHTAHEAGWLNVGQSSTVDLTWLVQPGSVQSALLTGMLGIQDHPVLIEVIGWLAYLVPIGLYVAWPPNRKLARRTLIRVTSGVAAVGALAAVVLVLVAPVAPVAPAAPATASISAQRTGSEVHDGLATDVYTSSRTGTASAGRPTQLTYAQVAALNGGRLPLGVRAQNTNTSVGVRYTDKIVVTLWVEPRTGRVIDKRSTETVLATLTGTQVGSVPLDNPVSSTTSTLPAATVDSAVAAARHDLDSIDRRSALLGGAWILGSIAVVALLILLGVLAKRPSSFLDFLRSARTHR